MNALSAASAVEGLRDDELVAAVREGDAAAFEELYRRYSRPVRAYIHRLVDDYGRAEDLTQEAFLSALRRLGATDAEIKFKPWIFEIAKNASIDLFRGRARAAEVSLDGQGVLAGGDLRRLIARVSRPEAAVLDKERLAQLQGAFAELSETHHRILVLRELDGLSYREIAERMQLSASAVESTLFRARRRLHHEYKQLDSGARCAAMVSAIARHAAGVESPRDRHKLDRHVRRCRACRQRAHALGVVVIDRSSKRSRVAALLPFPAFLRHWASSLSSAGSGSAQTASGGGAAGVQQAATGLLPATLAQVESAAPILSKTVAIIASAAMIGGGAAIRSTAPESARAGAAEAAALVAGDDQSSAASRNRPADGDVDRRSDGSSQPTPTQQSGEPPPVAAVAPPGATFDSATLTPSGPDQSSAAPLPADAGDALTPSSAGQSDQAGVSRESAIAAGQAPSDAVAPAILTAVGALASATAPSDTATGSGDTTAGTPPALDQIGIGPTAALTDSAAAPPSQDLAPSSSSYAFDSSGPAPTDG